MKSLEKRSFRGRSALRRMASSRAFVGQPSGQSLGFVSKSGSERQRIFLASGTLAHFHVDNITVFLFGSKLEEKRLNDSARPGPEMLAASGSAPLNYGQSGEGAYRERIWDGNGEDVASHVFLCGEPGFL